MKYRILITCLCGIAAFWSCSESEHPCDEPDVNVPIAIDAITPELGDTDTGEGVQTRAIADFVVNRPGFDPTKGLTGRETGWTLAVDVYYQGAVNTDGSGLFTYNNSIGRWTSDKTVFFPNYLTQRVAARLYPDGWNDDPIASDQSDPDVFILQDILEQNGSPTTNVTPARIPTIPMRHANSMLDFILWDVDETMITDVTVITDAGNYTPMRVDASTKVEYLVILPVGTTGIQVRITTELGATYYKDIPVTQTTVNRCYCIELVGIELVLSSITVANWTYGKAVAGEYSTVTSYPTFRGIAGQTITLYYNNGQEQQITFNERGEITVKPLGRTIIKIEKADGSFLDVNIILRGMIIDLTNYLLAPL